MYSVTSKHWSVTVLRQDSSREQTSDSEVRLSVWVLTELHQSPVCMGRPTPLYHTTVLCGLSSSISMDSED